MPATIFFAIMLIASVYYSIQLYQVLHNFCMEFRNHLNADTFSCPMLMNHFAINQTIVSPASNYILAETLTVFVTVLWFVTLAIMIIRCMFVIDFELVHVIIYEITEPEMLKQLTKKMVGSEKKIIYASQFQSCDRKDTYSKTTENVSDLCSKKQQQLDEVNVDQEMSKHSYSIDTTNNNNSNLKQIDESDVSAVKMLGDIFVDVKDNDTSSSHEVKVPHTGLYDAIQWRKSAKFVGSVLRSASNDERESSDDGSKNSSIYATGENKQDDNNSQNSHLK